ncbi:MAG: O-linked N-acetylglucosamine transferase, SPINDLY family protein, partial [Planctomycetota bacterium]
HTGRNRLHVLGFKPAPIQVSYLGYPNTTGMTQVDYRLTDAIADTPDQQKYYTEKLVYLPNGFLCYDPGPAKLPVKALPMLTNKFVTFGSFNNITKLNPFMVKIWADTLNAVPNSKLILKFHEGADPQVQEYYYNLFAEHGLENAHERIKFFGWLTNAQHLELYNNVDIALDTYPYNGTTTTCEAVLMGVPVITLVGSRHASRVSFDILSRLDMPSFAAHTPEEYVKKTVAVAAEPDILSQIRDTMRRRLAVSSLCDYKLITSDIENAYQKMWQDYCCSKGIEIKEIKPPSDADYKPRRYADSTIGKLSAGNQGKKILGLDNWEQPDWLKEARRFVSQGESEKAAQILSEEALEKHIEAASLPEKEFIRYAVASLLYQIKQPQRTEILYKEILKSMPKNIAVHNELAGLCRNQGRVNEAVEYLQTAIRIKPDESRIEGNLGVFLLQLGQTDEAMELLRKTVKQTPDNNAAYSNLLLSMHYVPGITRKDIFEESKRWAQSNAPAHLAKTRHNNDPDPNRRLRIGYISPDFRQHSIAFFIEPLLDGHNQEVVEVYGYGNITTPDETTKRLKEKFDTYHDIKTLTDKEVVDLIKNDEIDILVDLAGHTGDTRVYVMAYKPAPIQVTWLGYPDTTGMSQVDYRITDSIADPPGSQEFYTEQLYNLPDSFLCYGPGESMPPFTPLSALKKGHITFGAFSESCKINSVVIDLWSRILKATKDSELLLK